MIFFCQLFFHILYQSFTRGGFKTKTKLTKNGHCATRGKEWREGGFKTKIKLTKGRLSPSRKGFLKLGQNQPSPLSKEGVRPKQNQKKEDEDKVKVTFLKI